MKGSLGGAVVSVLVSTAGRRNRIRLMVDGFLRRLAGLCVHPTLMLTLMASSAEEVIGGQA